MLYHPCGGSAGISLGYEFDAVGNLKRLRDGNQADPPTRIYGYDPLNRLTEAKDASDVVWQSYNYDKTGNRQTAGWRELVAQEDCTGAPPGGPCTPLPPAAQWSTDAYTYHPATHRLFSRTGRERSYDGAGNLVLDAPMGVAPIDPAPGGGGTESAAYEGTMQVMEEGGEELPPPGAVSRTYSYNAANRMSGTSLGGEFLMGYRYNGRGERVYRQGADRTVHTVFDDAGRWIGDYDGDGAAIQQAIWLGDLPVGLLAKDSGITRLFHIEADALGSPRVVIDPTRGTNGTVVWRWDLAGEGFGNDKPDEDPDGDEVAFVLDMRYPGQQYDSASGLNYNYFRDYEAATGRYVESDPIGLKGGISTFDYTHGNPLLWVDPKGLSAITCTNIQARLGRGATGAIQCDGKGGYEIVACNTSCLNKCTIKHEGRHVRDWVMRYGANSCANRARGDIPVDDNATALSLTYEEDFRDMTECAAYQRSIDCANQIISQGCECRAEAEAYKKGAESIRERYKCSRF